MIKFGVRKIIEFLQDMQEIFFYTFSQEIILCFQYLLYHIIALLFFSLININYMKRIYDFMI